MVLLMVISTLSFAFQGGLLWGSVLYPWVLFGVICRGNDGWGGFFIVMDYGVNVYGIRVCLLPSRWRVSLREGPLGVVLGIYFMVALGS